MKGLTRGWVAHQTLKYYLFAYVDDRYYTQKIFLLVPIKLRFFAIFT
jgi:hypothetical protein